MEAMGQLFKKFGKFDELIEHALEQIQAQLGKVGEGVYKRGNSLKVGLAGGKTPLPLYQAMAERWPGEVLDTFLIDERYVDWTDVRSNYFQVSKIFPQVNSFNTALAIEHALAEYREKLPKKFDLAIVGVGSDGHFASVFTGMTDSTEQVFYSQTELYEVRERMTVSAEYLLKSGKIIIVLSGNDKLAVFEELQNGSQTAKDFPAKILLQHPELEILFAEGN